MMRILRVILTVDPRWGGPVEGMLRTSRILSERGHVTEIVTLDDPSDSWVQQCPFPVHATGSGTGPLGYRFGRGIRRWIKSNSNRFDVAVVHGLWNDASIGGWSGLTKSGLPYVIFPHGMLDPYFRDISYSKHLLKQAYWIVQGRALRDAWRVLFTSHEEMMRARGVFWGYGYRESVVAYGARDVSNGGRDEREGDIANVLPELSGKSYLLFLGRMHPKKGCDLLIDAFPKALEKRPELHLVMAGPDERNMIPTLSKRASDLGILNRVHFPGMLVGDAKKVAFLCAEAFVLPSHQENFGISVAEALSAGAPALITNKVNIWREVLEEGAGLVDDDTLPGVERILSNWSALSYDERCKYSEEARRLYLSKFTVSAAADDLEAALFSAVGGRNDFPIFENSRIEDA